MLAPFSSSSKVDSPRSDWNSYYSLLAVWSACFSVSCYSCHSVRRLTISSPENGSGTPPTTPIAAAASRSSSRAFYSGSAALSCAFSTLWQSLTTFSSFGRVLASVEWMASTSPYLIQRRPGAANHNIDIEVAIRVSPTCGLVRTACRGLRGSTSALGLACSSRAIACRTRYSKSRSA